MLDTRVDRTNNAAE